MFSKKNIISLLSLAIIALALPLAVNLAKQQQILHSKAGTDPITYLNSDGSTITPDANGNLVTHSLAVKVALNAPAPSANPTSAPTGAPITGPNILQSDMISLDVDGTPKGSATPFLGPGTYTMSGDVSWTPVFPENSGFQEIASLQADVWSADGATYITTYGNPTPQSVINNTCKTPENSASSRAYSVNTTFTIPAGQKVALLERSANTKASFKNVTLVNNANTTDTSIVSLSSGSTNKTRGIGGTDGSQPDSVRGHTYMMQGAVDPASTAGSYLDVAEWKIVNGQNVWIRGHRVGEVFTVGSDTDFIQAAMNVPDNGTANWSGAKIVEFPNLASALANRDWDGTPAGKGQLWIDPGTYRLVGSVSWTPVFPEGSGFQEIAALQADEWTLDGSTFIQTYGAPGPASVINNTCKTAANSASSRAYNVDITFTIPAGHKAAIIERAENTQAHFRNVQLIKQ